MPEAAPTHLKQSASSDSDSRYNVPNLERGLKMLELLLEHPEGLQQTEIAARLGCAKTSVYRISMTLMEFGYVVRDEDTKTIRLSRKLVAMGSRVLAEEDLLVVSGEAMKSLRDRIGETVLVGALVGTELVVLGQVLGSHHFKFSVDLGTRLPLHAAAPGKAILARLPAAERDQILQKLSFDRFNERTICDVKEFVRELEQVGDLGYALDRGEQLSGIHCVAAPILNRHGYPLASIWVTGPTDRLRRGDFPAVGEIVRQHALTISGRLGWRALGDNGTMDK
jgi:DNA-binding IclR family transcriptional regulator